MAVSISLAITQNSQDIAKNTSNVTVKVTASWTYGSYNATGQCTGSITIDGTKYSFSGIKFNTGESTSGSQVIMTKTVDVSHGSDGKKTLSCSASFVTGVSSGTVSCSGSKALTTIPRKSTLSVGNGTLGTAQTLTVTRQSSDFTHTITYSCGSASGTIVTKSTSTSISFTPPLSLAAQNTTGTSVSVKYTITTYNGNTSLGSNSYTKTCSIPASVKPTVSISVSDAMGYQGTYGGYIQGMSKFKITVTASGSQGSTIKSYQTKADGKTYTTASITTNVISNSGTLTVSTTVTDSRGRTASASISVTVLAYAKPQINSLTVFRSDSSGNATSSGVYLTATFDYSITSLNSKNTAKIKLQYKKNSATSYSNGTVSNGKCIFEADATSTYDILLSVSDNFFEVTKTTIGSSISKLFSWFSRTTNNVKKYGFAIGKIAEHLETFEVAFQSMFRKDVMIGNKEGYLDGKTGIHLDSEGFMQIQRDSSQGYHPYIAFLLDDETSASGQIRLNCIDKYMEFLSDLGYRFGNKITLPNNKFIFIEDKDGTERNVFGVNDNNNLLVGWDMYDKALGNTIIYGNDVAILPKTSGETSAFRPYKRKGDSLTLALRTAGYVTNSGKHVAFWIPMASPIVGSPNVSITSGTGFVLRQGEKYTHGSSATVSVSPESYEAVITPFNGISVTATFSNVINVTNNDAIGIYWNGTITFS